MIFYKKSRHYESGDKNLYPSESDLLDSLS